MLEPDLLGPSCRGRADGISGARPRRLDALATVDGQHLFSGRAWRHLLACIGLRTTRRVMGG